MRCPGERERCLDSSQSVSQFRKTNGTIPNIVGSGDIIPYCRYFQGALVSSKNIVVRFENVPIPADGEYDETRQKQLLLWKKDEVSRVDVLGEFKNKIGTAILCADPFVAGKQVGQQGDVLNGAVLLCDFMSMTEKNGTVYPFQMWYETSNMSPLVPVHFQTDKVPFRACLFESPGPFG